MYCSADFESTLILPILFDADTADFESTLISWFNSNGNQNSEFKWKIDTTVIGAFEIATEPDLDLKAPMTLHKINGCKDELKRSTLTLPIIKVLDE